MAENYRASLPPKLNQDRGSAGGAGYPRANIQRSGVATQNSPPVKTGAATKMTLQPSGSARPTPIADPNQAGENGFSPDRVISETEPDAQSEQTTQPELDIDIAAPPVPENTERPTDGGISDPTPGDSDPGSSGAAEAPGYQGLTDASHPRGYPSN